MKLSRLTFIRGLLLSAVLLVLVLLCSTPAAHAQAAGSDIPEEQTFVIRDNAQNLLKIEQLIRSLDLPPRQVLIEAHIFDVALDQ